MAQARKERQGQKRKQDEYGQGGGTGAAGSIGIDYLQHDHRKVAHGEEHGGILHDGVHGHEGKGNAGESGTERTDHGDYADDKREHGKQAIEGLCPHQTLR